MKEIRFTEEQIIKVLKEHKASASLADIIRGAGISEATFYNWRSKYDGQEVNEAKRLKELEAENAGLKKLFKACRQEAGLGTHGESTFI